MINFFKENIFVILIILILICLSILEINNPDLKDYFDTLDITNTERLA